MLFEIYRRSAIAAHQIEDRHPTLTPDFEAKVKARSAVIRGTRKAEERAATIKELDAKQAALTKTRKEALGEKVEEPPAPIHDARGRGRSSGASHRRNGVLRPGIKRCHENAVDDAKAMRTWTGSVGESPIKSGHGMVSQQ